MHVSLNEVENTALKAARGAGSPWGIAEEAGRASRWLAARGLPWLAPLTAMLEARLASPVTAHADCPILAGTRIVDVWPLRGGAAPALPKAIRAPLLLVPFLAQASESGVPVAVSWPGVVAHLIDGALQPEVADMAALAAEGPLAAAITVGAAAQIHGAAVLKPRTGGAEVEPQLFDRLRGLAARTYVPESEQSKLKGAGAGLLDND
ncbi:MAG: DUF3726 domain-containing protein [Hyphomicrobiaceae bacterium]